MLAILALLVATPERVMAYLNGDFGYMLAAAAVDRTRSVVIYDSAYRQIPYPWGDVAPNRGVCTDVVVRAYRALGYDLQRLVHERMGGDSNIAHRRVPELRQFFARYGQSLPVSSDPREFKPGDIVTYEKIGKVYSSATHIGVVSARWSWDMQRPLIVHNMGFGEKLDDALFLPEFRMTGHYRYRPPPADKG